MKQIVILFVCCVVFYFGCETPDGHEKQLCAEAESILTSGIFEGTLFICNGVPEKMDFKESKAEITIVDDKMTIHLWTKDGVLDTILQASFFCRIVEESTPILITENEIIRNQKDFTAFFDAIPHRLLEVHFWYPSCNEKSTFFEGVIVN